MVPNLNICLARIYCLFGAIMVYTECNFNSIVNLNKRVVLQLCRLGRIQIFESRIGCYTAQFSSKISPYNTVGAPPQKRIEAPSDGTYFNKRDQDQHYQILRETSALLRRHLRGGAKPCASRVVAHFYTSFRLRRGVTIGGAHSNNQSWTKGDSNS